jgi:KDO2-lipid IV(A) lauroyltransferase
VDRLCEAGDDRSTGDGPAEAASDRHPFAYWTYRSLATAIQAVPGPLVGSVATASGLVMSELWRNKRPIIRSNFRRVVGPEVSESELERVVVDAFDWYARYWVESARLGLLRPAEVFKRFSIEGFACVEEAMAQHRGVILALPHFGFWDLGGLWLTLKGYPMTTVVEPLEPPALFEWFRAQREALGLTIHPLGPQAPGQLMKALRAGRLVGLVADRDLGGNGVDVEFFGEVTKLPGGPAVLAIRTGAPLFPSIVYQALGGKGHGLIRPPLEIERTGNLRRDVTRLTQLLAAEFETLISRAPEQWHMFQPNWPSDREK